MHLLEFRFAALRAHLSSMKFPPPPCSQPQPLKLTIKSLKPSPDRSLRNFPSAVHNLCSAYEELDLKIHRRCSFVQLVALIKLAIFAVSFDPRNQYLLMKVLGLPVRSSVFGVSRGFAASLGLRLGRFSVSLKPRAGFVGIFGVWGRGCGLGQQG